MQCARLANHFVAARRKRNSLHAASHKSTGKEQQIRIVATSFEVVTEIKSWQLQKVKSGVNQHWLKY